jgi:hypothetical protein
MSMSASAKALAAIVAAVLVLPAAAGATPHLKKVGHEPLMKRGMNAAIAIHGDYAYIGSRTDGGHEDMLTAESNGLPSRSSSPGFEMSTTTGGAAPALTAHSSCGTATRR